MRTPGRRGRRAGRATGSAAAVAGAAGAWLTWRVSLLPEGGSTTPSRGRVLATPVQLRGDRLAGLLGLGGDAAAVREDPNQHVADDPLVLDVHPVRRGRHEPTRAGGAGERGDLLVRLVDAGERGRVRQHLADGRHVAHQVRAGELLQPVDRELLVPARHRDRQVGAAEERRHELARRVARHRERADLVLERGVARVLVEGVAPLPAVGDDRADLALAEYERLGRVGLVTRLVRLRVGADDLLQAGQGLDRLRRVERALPLAALELGDLAAVVVHEGHRREPVLAGAIERRVAPVLAELRL